MEGLRRLTIFPEIARHMGSDATPSAVDHRLRPIKQLAKLQDSCLKHGGDPKDLPVEKTGTGIFAFLVFSHIHDSYSILRTVH